MKNYNVTTKTVAAIPRKARKNATAYGISSGGGSTIITQAAAAADPIVVEEAHTHANKSALDKMDVDANDYIFITQVHGDDEDSTTNKAKAGDADHAANADQWDGHTFGDFLNQPLRTIDAATFQQVAAEAVVTPELVSESFASGFGGSGHRLQMQGGVSTLELDSITVRRTMRIFELLIEKVRSIGGTFVVSPANAKVASTKWMRVPEGEHFVTNLAVTFESTDGTPYQPFVAGDLVRCQRYTGGAKSYWVRVNAADDTYAYFSDLNLPIAAGDEVVLLGNTTDTTRQGAIIISATENAAPTIDILDGIHTTSLDGCLKVRLGDLSGLGAVNGITPQGYGLYSDNAYLKGRFVLGAGSVGEGQEVGLALGQLGNQIDKQRTEFAAELGRIVAAVTNGSKSSMMELTADTFKVIAENILMYGLAQFRVGGDSGQRVEIDPTMKAIRIFDREGDLVNEIIGDSLTSEADVFNGLKNSTPEAVSPLPSFDMGMAAIAGADDSKSGVLPISSVWHTKAPAKVTASVQCRAQVQATGVTTNAGDTYTIANASVRLVVSTYDNAACEGEPIGRAQIAGGLWHAAQTGNGSSEDNHEATLIGSVTTACGHHRLELLWSASGISRIPNDPGNPAYRNVRASATTLTVLGVSNFDYNVDLYRSVFFANGFCLGTATNNFVMAKRSDRSDRAMTFTVANPSGGIRLTQNGTIQTRLGATGQWRRLPTLVCHGLIGIGNLTTTETTLSITHFTTYNGDMPTVVKLSTGKARFYLPATWNELSLHYGNTIRRVTPTAGRCSAQMSNISTEGSRSYFDITSYDGSNLGDITVEIELWLCE